MKVIRVNHTLECSAERYWALYLDETFTRTLFVEHMGWSDPTIEIVKDDEEELLRTMEAQPKLDIPGAVARMISKTLGYHEDGRFDRVAQRFTMRHHTNIFGDKLDLEGSFTLEDLGPDRCRRDAEVRVDAKIFGVGGLLERVVESNVIKLWDQNARFTNDWVRQGR